MGKQSENNLDERLEHLSSQLDDVYNKLEKGVLALDVPIEGLVNSDIVTAADCVVVLEILRDHILDLIKDDLGSVDSELRGIRNSIKEVEIHEKVR